MGPGCLLARLSWADWDGPVVDTGSSAQGVTHTITGCLASYSFGSHSVWVRTLMTSHHGQMP